MNTKLLPAKDENDPPTITKNNRDRIVDLFETGDGHESIQGTAWAEQAPVNPAIQAFWNVLLGQLRGVS